MYMSVLVARSTVMLLGGNIGLMLSEAEWSAENFRLTSLYSITKCTAIPILSPPVLCHPYILNILFTSPFYAKRIRGRGAIKKHDSLVKYLG